MVSSKLVMALAVFTIIGVATVKNWGEQMGTRLGLSRPSAQQEESLDPDELRNQLDENSTKWEVIQSQSENLLNVYETRLAKAQDDVEYSQHKQKSLGQQFHVGEKNGFPVEWMGEWYDKSDLLNQFEKFLVQEDRGKARVANFQQAIDSVQECLAMCDEKLAANELNKEMIDASVLVESQRSLEDADSNSKKLAFQMEPNDDNPVRTPEEIRADEEKIERAANRLKRLEEIVASVDDDSDQTDDSKKSDLVFQIQGIVKGE